MKRPEKLSRLRYASQSKLNECVRKKDDVKQKFIHHKITEGETVYRLSRIYNTTVEEIIILNNILDINDIPIGTTLLIENKSDIWKLSWPLKGTITSRFGKRNGRFHYGIDVAAKKGTPIRSAFDGVVILSGSNIDGFGGYGRLIVLQHSKDIVSVYAHNNSNYVSEGLCVKEGEVIGEVGSTGNATGPHLHFEIRKNTEPVDPYIFLN